MPPARLHLQRLANSLNAQAAHAGDASGGQPQFTEHQLGACVSPSVAEALKRLSASEAARDSDSNSSCEYLVVIHVVPCGGGVTTTVHASLLPLPTGLPPAVAVAVASQRRPEPFDAKSSAWVAQRGALSALCPPDCVEVITTIPRRVDEADDASCAPLVEGLVNNLFVIATTKGGQHARCVVHTASVAEGALPGIVRIAVLSACTELGYPVVEAAPVPPPEHGDDSAGEVWSEAFLCNAVRLIQPIRHMRWLPPCTRPGLDFPDAPGVFTRAIAAHVLRDMTSEASLSPPFT